MLTKIQYILKIPFIVFLLTLSSCETNQLYVAHDTILGINANYNQTRTSGRVAIGYDRYVVTLIPRSVHVAPDPDDGIPPNADDVLRPGKEAMSVLSCSSLQIEGIFLTEFIERLATGRAARTLAESQSGSGLRSDEENGFKCE